MAPYKITKGKIKIDTSWRSGGEEGEAGFDKYIKSTNKGLVQPTLV